MLLASLPLSAGKCIALRTVSKQNSASDVPFEKYLNKSNPTFAFTNRNP